MACLDLRRNEVTGNDPEKVSNVQKTNQRATNKTRKEVLKIYADMAICAIDQLDWYQQCATTNFLQLL